jgi:hypothetical protein
MIPPPLLDEHGLPRHYSYDLLAALTRGGFGACVTCHQGCYSWLDLTALGMPAVVDDHGHPTDQLPLHREHVADLMEYWAELLHPDPDDGDPRPVVRARQPRPAPDPAPAPEPVPDPAPMGAYARLGAR